MVRLTLPGSDQPSKGVLRERERDSLRWQPFSTLVSGGAAMPEPGFAWGLYYRASGQVAWGKKAVDWALSDEAKDLRQLALVFDWCGPAMTDTQADRLAAKLERALTASTGKDVRQQSARAFAAIALADRLPDHGESVMKSLIEQWWRSEIVKKLPR